MSKSSMKAKAQALLTLVEQLAQMPGLTWVDANNAIFSHRGPFVRLFPSKAERVAFGKTKESELIDGLICSLPEPPVSPIVEHIDAKLMIPIPQRKQPRPASHTRNGKRPRRRRKAASSIR